EGSMTAGFCGSNTRHVRTLEVARTKAFCLGMIFLGKPLHTFPDHALRKCVKVKVKSAHHEGIELVAVGIAEIAGIELRAALTGRALAGAAERQRKLMDTVNLLLVLGAEGGHHAVA